MYNKRLIFIAGFTILLWFPFGANAQINESDTLKFQLRASLSGNYQTGNVEDLIIRGKMEFTYTPVHEFVIKSQNNSLYQEFYKVKADNEIYSRNYLYYKPEGRIYPFGIAYISTNYRREINLRSFEGLGLTYQLLKGQDHVIKLSGSAVYEETKFGRIAFNYDNYNGTDQINLWRGTCYLGGWHYFSNRKARFFYEAYWQPAFNNNNNYRTQADIGLEFMLGKGFAFNTLYSYTHENVVILGQKPEDKILTFGISYNLKVK